MPDIHTRGDVALRALPGFPTADEPTAQRSRLDAIVAGVAAIPPCVQRLALPTPTGWVPGEVECHAEVGDEVCWGGLVFGGYLAAVADLYGGLAMLTVLPDGARFVTAALNVVFAAPMVPGRLRITATVTQLSGRDATVQVLLRQRDRVTCQASTDQIIQWDPGVSTQDSPPPDHKQAARPRPTREET